MINNEDVIEKITIEQLRSIVSKQYKATENKSPFDKFLHGLEKYRRMSLKQIYDTSTDSIAISLRDRMIANGAKFPKPLSEEEMLYIDKTPKF